MITTGITILACSFCIYRFFKWLEDYEDMEQENRFSKPEVYYKMTNPMLTMSSQKGGDKKEEPYL